MADATAKDMEARPLAERIKMFAAAHHDQGKRYTGQDLYDWHHTLTGSCKAGRDAWCADNGLDPATASMTIAEFCRRTCNAYGGEIIRQLAEYMGIELDNPRRR